MRKLLEYTLIIPFFLVSCKSETVEALPECEIQLSEEFQECVEEVFIDAEECILQEVELSTFFRSVRYVYHHDGQNYSRIDCYVSSQDSEELWKMDLNYDEDGRILRAYRWDIQNSDLVGYTEETLFSYQGEFLTMTQTYYDSLGQEVGSKEKSILVAENTEDAFYYSEDSVWLSSYSGGNLVAVFVKDLKGACEIYDQQWSQIQTLHYDQRPNVFRDYAFVVPYAETNWLEGYELVDPSFSVNNLVGANSYLFDFNDNSFEVIDEIECLESTFLINSVGNFWIRTASGEGHTLNYIYDCE